VGRGGHPASIEAMSISVILRMRASTYAGNLWGIDGYRVVERRTAVETRTFDRLARLAGSRRRAFAGAIAGIVLLGMPEAGSAKKRKKRCKPKAGQCLCKSGEVCLDGGSCGKPCCDHQSASDCPSGCHCGYVGVNSVCMTSINSRAECQTLSYCGAGGKCPKGTRCQPVDACEEDRCVPVCRA
jgi:hypothetical protein